MNVYVDSSVLLRVVLNERGALREWRRITILQVFRHFYGITERDSDDHARKKISGRLLALDEAYREVLPVLFEFFGVPDPALPAPHLDPEVKQRQLVGVLRKLVQHGAEDTVALIEDLHWIDGASAAWLEQWVDAIANLWRDLQRVLRHGHLRQHRLTEILAKPGLAPLTKRSKRPAPLNRGHGTAAAFDSLCARPAPLEVVGAFGT